ncbi:cysteine dioxygenase [Streptomyces sp. NPDC058674]|uniref:cysteine dioxygenase n=1 Tax=Streptomyces sp. NPDC058674 TaxID=3346592 RepID=UPI00364C7516
MSAPTHAPAPAAVAPPAVAPAPVAAFGPVAVPAPVAAPASVAAPAGGPTARQLLDFALTTAADPRVVASLPLDPQDRTWVRLDGPGGSEAWLIGWPPGTGTGWHDHAESRGAFATARGRLTENSLAVRLPSEGWKSLELAPGVDRERHVEAGGGRAFGEHHVHEVLNESPTEHAVSVHAYYPPLPLIRRYSRDGQVLGLEHVERPADWQ